MGDTLDIRHLYAIGQRCRPDRIVHNDELLGPYLVVPCSRHSLLEVRRSDNMPHLRIDRRYPITQQPLGHRYA